MFTLFYFYILRETLFIPYKVKKRVGKLSKLVQKFSIITHTNKATYKQQPHNMTKLSNQEE